MDDVEHTGVLDLGDPTYGPTQLQLFLDGPGECLVDNVEVIGPGGTNMVTNGDFENGLTGLDPSRQPPRFHGRARPGVDGSQCLHVRAESRGDPGANRIRGTLATGLKEGVTATLRARVRWLQRLSGVLAPVCAAITSRRSVIGYFNPFGNAGCAQ